MYQRSIKILQTILELTMTSIISVDYIPLRRVAIPRHPLQTLFCPPLTVFRPLFRQSFFRHPPRSTVPCPLFVPPLLIAILRLQITATFRHPHLPVITINHFSPDYSHGLAGLDTCNPLSITRNQRVDSQVSQLQLYLTFTLFVVDCCSVLLETFFFLLLLSTTDILNRFGLPSTTCPYIREHMRNHLRYQGEGRSYT